MTDDLSNLSPIPPPRRSRAGIVTAIVEAVIALLLCSAILGWILYMQRDKNPSIAILFPTITPNRSLYSNTTMGIRLYYPPTWIYQEEDESGGMVLFATSQGVFENEPFPPEDAALVVLRSASFFEEIPANAEVNSPERMLHLIVSQEGGFLSEGASEFEPIFTYSINGNAAASTAYTITESGSPSYNWYITYIATGGVPVMAVGICSMENWISFRPLFDETLNSIEISPMQQP